MSIKPIYPEIDHFIGKCVMYFKSADPSNKCIILNMVNIKIKSVILYNNANISIPITNIIISKKSERVKIICNEIPQNGYISFKYIGSISSELTGVIKAVHGTDYVIYTQFEPHSARRCFPCIDEPSYKAIYDINIESPIDKTILSNSSIKYIIRGKNVQRVYFNSTPLMSTYLVAFYIGHATQINRKSKYGVNIGIYSVSDKSESIFALDVAEKALDYITELFNYKYPMSKLDLVAVPQFAASAMENWGLVIFRQKCLILEKDMSIDQKIKIAYVIAHELAHQWFGNLVTMEWWDDLWLNESFATWVGWHVANKIFPEWNVWEHFYINENMVAMESDAVENSHPIKMTILNVNNVNEIFDEISYSKGGSILRMLIETIGMNDFINGMQYYFKKYAYKNCCTNDLWKALSISSKLDVAKLMDTWINSIGYPIIYCYKKNNKIKLYQEKFTFQVDNKLSICNDIWNIPTISGMLSKKTHKIEQSGGSNVLSINPNGIGYYRVNYQPELLYELLNDNINTKTLTNLDFAHILNDLYYLLKARMIKLVYYLDIIKNITMQLSITNVSVAIADSLIHRYAEINLIGLDNFTKKYESVIKSYVENVYQNIIRNKVDVDESIILYVKRACIQFKMTDKTYIESYNQKFSIFESESKYLVIGAILSLCTNHYDECVKYLMEEIKIESKQEEICNVIGLVNKCDDYLKVLGFIMSPKILNQYKINLINSCGRNNLHKNYLWSFIKNNWLTIYNCFKNNQFGLNRTIQSLEHITDNNIAIEISDFFSDKKTAGMTNSLNCLIEIIKVNSLFRNYIHGQLL